MSSKRRLALAAVLLLAACRSDGGREAASEPAAPSAAVPRLVDRAAAWGLDFVHRSGASGRLYIAEIMGSGGALLDYDRDGDLDVYLVQGGALAGGGAARPAGDRLFRNDLASGPAGRPRFVDVTATSGLVATGYGMGVATADVDGDGWTDLYLTNFGADRLWRNRGDGTFEDWTLEAGVSDPVWSVGASFFDADRDGDLDLYVANYVDFSPARHLPCYGPGSAPDYCGPGVYGSLPDRFYRNRGDGRFDDVTAAAGILRADPAPGLGTVAFDFDDDGWTDLYVANDGTENRLWRNLGDGAFEDVAVLAGCAVNGSGAREASMGVDAGDFDGDGDEDLFLTHLDGETNTLYVNLGDGGFRDATDRLGLGAPSFKHTSFGTRFADLDNDGWLDLPVVGGAIKRAHLLARPGAERPLANPGQLFRNLGGDRGFVEVTAEVGPDLARWDVGRGLAAGDVDNDGDLDLLVTQNDGPARLLESSSASRRAWLGLRVVERTGQEAVGAEATAERRGLAPLRRRLHTDGSYASASDPRLLLGLGDRPADAVGVAWAAAPRLRLVAPPAGRYLVVPPPGSE